MALNFDGVDDGVDHGDVTGFDGAAAFTIMAWVKPDTLVTTDYMMAKGDVDVSWAFVWGTDAVDKTKSKCFIGAATGTMPTGALTDGTWTHIAYVYDGAGAANADRLKGYKDGVAQTLAFSGTVPATATDAGAATFVVGHGNGAAFSDVRFANVRAWSVALSAAEVALEDDQARAVVTAGLILDCPYDTDGTDVSGGGWTGTISGATVDTAGPPVSGTLAIGAGSYTLTGTDIDLALSSSTTGGLVFDYVLSQESSEAIWPSRMTQMADWAVPAYISGERVVLYTKSGSNQIWVLGNNTTGTLTTYIDTPWMSRQDDTKVTKWLGLVAAYASTVAVSVYIRYANNPGEFEAASWVLRGTLPANPTIAEGARIVFGGSTRWVQVRFLATTLAGGGFELFPPIQMVPVDTMRSPN